MGDFIIKYWLEFLFAALVGWLGAKYKKLKKKQEEQEQKNTAIEEGVQALLRNELVKSYREYKTKGELTILDEENIRAMFEQYKNLGGNGTVKHLMDELFELPTKVVDE